MAEPRISSEVFAAAVDRLSAHRARPVVVKLGGSAMEDPAATDACLKSVATLNRLGVPLVLVHGGGKPIDRAMAEAGLTPKKVAGRRYTDEATLAIVVRVLGEINSDIARRLDEFGVRAAPVMIVHDYPLFGRRLTLPQGGADPVDLGYVGSVTSVNAGRLEMIAFECRTVPVVPSLARSDDSPSGWLNVNADTAASAVAGALKADKAIFLTDTPGVLRDRTDPKSLIPKLTRSRVPRADRVRGHRRRDGAEGGGVLRGARRRAPAAALILDGRVPYSLLDVFLHDTFTGTDITR